MSFHTRKSLIPSGIFIPDVVEESLKDGELIRDRVDAHKDFPTEEFDLSEMLKAGVPLDSVNTQVIGSASVDLPSDFGSEDVSVDPNEKTKDKE